MGRQPLLINSPGLGLRHSFFEGALLEQKHADSTQDWAYGIPFLMKLYQKTTPAVREYPGLRLRHSFFEGALLEQKHADNSAAFCLKEVILEQVLLTSFKQKSTTNKVCDASVQVARPRIELGTS